MTATAETTVESPCHGKPAVTTPTMATPGHGNATPAMALDLTLGERPEARCGVCGRLLPAIETPKFELEDAETGAPICDLDANRQHKGLRLAVALLNTALDDRAAGQWQRGQEALWAVFNGLELLGETAQQPAQQPARPRPVRNQPVRRARRGRRK